MSAPKVIIVSGCNDKYFFLYADLLMSLKALKFDFEFDLGLLDVGLGGPPREHLINEGVKVIAAGSDIDYPSRAHWEAQRPAVKASTARPFLRKYFPGYDIYVWLDADVWVQTPVALNHMVVSAAASPAIHMAPEIDRCYQPFFQQDGMWQIYHDWYQKNFGDEIAKAMLTMPMLNCGVLAMAKDSPVWDAWGKLYGEALQKVTAFDSASFMAEQLALNILIYLHKMPCIRMPAAFNWLTCYALPYLDRKTGMYVEPGMPFQPISQIHLTRENKIQIETLRCLDGGTVERPLTFSKRQG